MLDVVLPQTSAGTGLALLQSVAIMPTHSVACSGMSVYSLTDITDSTIRQLCALDTHRLHVWAGLYTSHNSRTVADLTGQHHASLPKVSTRMPGRRTPIS